MTAIPGREEDFMKTFEITMECAKMLNCKRIHFLAGINPGYENSQETRNTLEYNLRRIEPELRKYGIVGLVEAINNVTLPGYVLSDYDAGKCLSNLSSVADTARI